jgi:hypothetical protein
LTIFLGVFDLLVKQRFGFSFFEALFAQCLYHRFFIHYVVLRGFGFAWYEAGQQ